MRRFKLINALGAEYDLMDKNHFFNSPDGLGFAKDIEYARIGNYYKELENYSDQKKPNGEIIFNDYTEFQAFNLFISKTPLKLCYKPLETWYYIDCSVTKLEKSEIDRNSGKLICDIDFTANSMWYLPVTTFQLDPTGVETAKIYPYTYDYVYFDNEGGEINVSNNGFTEAPCEIGIYGPLTNPYWKLMINNEEYREGKLNVTIPEGYILIINSKPQDYFIKRYAINTGFYVNYLTYSDFTTERFIKIPIGISKILVGDDTENALKAYVKVYQEYETI